MLVGAYTFYGYGSCIPLAVVSRVVALICGVFLHLGNSLCLF